MHLNLQSAAAAAVIDRHPLQMWWGTGGVCDVLQAAAQKQLPQ